MINLKFREAAFKRGDCNKCSSFDGIATLDGEAKILCKADVCPKSKPLNNKEKP